MIMVLSRWMQRGVKRVRLLKRRPMRKVELGEGLESRHLLSRASLLSGLSGMWSGIFTNAATVVGPISGLGTSAVQFGTPFAPGGPQSSLSFTGSSIPTTMRVRHHTSIGLVVGNLTFKNTELIAPPLTGINLKVTAQSNIGSAAVNLPLGVSVTPNLSPNISADTITLLGRPSFHIGRHAILQVVGFGIANPRGGLVSLSNHMNVAENSTLTVPILAKVIRI